MKLSFRAAVALACSVALIVVAESPVLAATPTAGALVSGSSLSAIDCDESPGQLYSVDVSNAAGTAIGGGTSIEGSTCPGGGAWDPVTKVMYYVAYARAHTDLVSVDLTTGVSTLVGILQTTVPQGINAIAIGANGAAYAVSNTELFSLDLATGALVDIGNTGSNYLYGFAFDPVSQAFYVLNYRTGQYSTVNTTTGAATLVGTTAFPANRPEALQIDVNGTFWVEVDNGVNADVWSFDPAHPADAVRSGSFAIDGNATYIETLLLKPAVPPTISSAAPAGSVSDSTVFSYTVTATGSPTITFAITAGALPPGLTLDPATGVISGTPTTPGTYRYTVSASNGAGVADLAITQTVTAAVHLPIVSG